MLATIIAEAAHGGEGLLSETWELLQNPAHWVFEYVSAIPAYLLGRWRLKVHDRKHHKGHVS